MDQGTGSYRFNDHYELARLPYFELREGRLVLADDSFGPSIDMHTHVANAYLIARQIDLHRFYEKTDIWLPPEAFLDLDIYANQNVTSPMRSKMVRSFFARSVLDPVGGGMRKSATIPNLRRDMADLGIKHSLVLPIDLPLISRNAQTQLEATRGCEELICFGSVHPFDPRAEEHLEQQQQLGAQGIKLHPNIQKVRPDHPRALKLQRLCADRGMMVLWHCGPTGIEDWASQQRSQVRFYEDAIAQNPHGTFILGHAGALQAEQALELARRYDNVWLELSCQSLTSLRRILELGPPDRLMMGSDWPMYHQAIPLAKLLLLTEGNEQLRRQVLYQNAARLLKLQHVERSAASAPATQHAAL